ncbi:hypothetical protein R5H30_13620 [Sulfitobacter sp. D35]|uniref:hypothetical protein n=1 Tax=Sulfitobacter sp. D35 TaxID=3083252 RepID=UPI00296FE348|nr:hypothetical protein [Sulfitobacter sp. D35]MDW4499029.1 hypothetical protein [Sulfitobacter sp. D35]
MTDDPEAWIAVGMMRSGSTMRFRRVAVWVLLAPFLLLSTLSGGVMPHRTADGLVLVICTGDGPIEVTFDADGSAPTDTPAEADRCDWASGTQAATIFEATVPPPVATVVRRADASVTPFVLVAGRATGLPPSTGPPSSV